MNIVFIVKKKKQKTIIFVCALFIEQCYYEIFKIDVKNKYKK